MSDRTFGPRMRRLIALKVGAITHSELGARTIGDYMKVITTPGKLAELFRQAVKEVDADINHLKKLADNPYGDDEEKIADYLVRVIEGGKP